MDGKKEKIEAVANITDVAKRAGVSKATVSRALNRPYLVNQHTLEKVQETMRELNYKPNIVARSMRLQKTKTIGVVIPDLQNFFYSGMLAQLEREFRVHDYVTIICPTSGDFEEEKEYIERVVYRQVDGILHFTYNNSEKHIDSILKIAGDLPFILMDESREELSVSQVVSNGYRGVVDAVEKLIQGGYERIAYVGSDTEASSNRLQGYLYAMDKNGLCVPNGYMQSGGFTIADGRQAAKNYMQLDVLPQAIVCSADSIAVGVMKELIENNIQIPQQVQILGFDNNDISTIVSPALSTIGQNLPELASQASRMLLDMIENPQQSRNVNIVKVDTELILRETTSI